MAATASPDQLGDPCSPSYLPCTVLIAVKMVLSMVNFVYFSQQLKQYSQVIQLSDKVRAVCARLFVFIHPGPQVLGKPGGQVVGSEHLMYHPEP